MIVYKFYLWDPIEGATFLGALPERRRNSKRITDESIINWGKTHFGKNGKGEDIFFVKTVLEESEKRFPNLSGGNELGEKNKKVNSLRGFR